MSHVTHVNETCERVMAHMWMCHGTSMNGSWHICMNESWHNCEWVTSRISKIHVTHMNGSLIAQARIKEEQEEYQKQEAAGIIHTSVIHVRVICMRTIHIHTYRVRDGACGLLRTHTNTRRLHMHTYPVALW